jgi:hypothetical protein
MEERVPDAGLITNPLHEHDHIQATRGKGYAFIYTSQGKEMSIVMGKITANQLLRHGIIRETVKQRKREDLKTGAN